MVSYVIQVWQADAGGVVRWKHSPNHQHYSTHTNTILQTPPKPKHTQANPSMQKDSSSSAKVTKSHNMLNEYLSCWYWKNCFHKTTAISSQKGNEYIQKYILNISKVWKALSILKMQKTLPYSIGDQYFRRCQLLNFQMVKASVTPVDTKFKQVPSSS